MRPSWDTYFMEITEIVATRSTCLRRKIGAILVKDKRILATGYNGPPSGMKHCNETNCLRDELQVPSGERHELCRGLHAEQNVIIQGALYGISTLDTILYSNYQPCSLCSKMIINAGIKGVIIKNKYPDPLALELLKEAGVTVKVWKGDGKVEWIT